jgi:hypothetical protein
MDFRGGFVPLRGFREDIHERGLQSFRPARLVDPDGFGEPGRACSIRPRVNQKGDSGLFQRHKQALAAPSRTS